MTKLPRVKQFVFDGILAARELQDLAKTLPIQAQDLVKTAEVSEATDPSWYSTELITAANRMAGAYFRLYLFENQVRQLVERVLRESQGEKWFTSAVPEPIRDEALRRKQVEGMAKFHSPRGEGLLHYVSLPDLGAIISKNWANFEPILYRKDWVLAKLEDLRLTRNAVAHMGEISDDDLSRLDVILNDWNRQVG